MASLQRLNFRKKKGAYAHFGAQTPLIDYILATFSMISTVRLE